MAGIGASLAVRSLGCLYQVHAETPAIFATNPEKDPRLFPGPGNPRVPTWCYKVTTVLPLMPLSGSVTVRVWSPGVNSVTPPLNVTAPPSPSWNV